MTGPPPSTRIEVGDVGKGSLCAGNRHQAEFDLHVGHISGEWARYAGYFAVQRPKVLVQHSGLRLYLCIGEILFRLIPDDVHNQGNGDEAPAFGGGGTRRCERLPAGTALLRKGRHTQGHKQEKQPPLHGRLVLDGSRGMVVSGSLLAVQRTTNNSPHPPTGRLNTDRVHRV